MTVARDKLGKETTNQQGSRAPINAQQKRTKKQALDSLISAGILTQKGNYTKPYHNLARAVKK